MDVFGVLQIAGACVFGGVAAGIFGSKLWKQRERRKRLDLARRALAPEDVACSSACKKRSLEEAIVERLIAESRKDSLSYRVSAMPQESRTNLFERKGLFGKGLLSVQSDWFEQHLLTAGLGERVSVEACLAVRSRCALAAMACGGVVGSVFSWQLAVLLSVVGCTLGFQSVRWAVGQIERERACKLERRISEMLEVMALGLRSGLSFDKSLHLYVSHFDTGFAYECAQAQQKWFLGLSTREDALRGLASTYASPFFARVVENMVRSLRFGSSMAESLERSAQEARAAYRARRQEQVAKAPVKMMIPTGTLMLPAMLLLVLGPVLLELMGGF